MRRSRLATSPILSSSKGMLLVYCSGLCDWTAPLVLPKVFVSMATIGAGMVRLRPWRVGDLSALLLEVEEFDDEKDEVELARSAEVVRGKLV